MPVHPRREGIPPMRTAVLGATGLVGRTMLRLLADCPWRSGAAAGPGERPLGRHGPALRRRVAGLPRGRPRKPSPASIWPCSAPAARPAGAGRPVAAAAGAWVVDNSSAFRMDAGGAAGGAGDQRCPGAGVRPRRRHHRQSQLLDHPDRHGGGAPGRRPSAWREVHVTTLQAVSGAGQKAVAELAPPGRPGEAPTAGVFPRPIAGNAIPAIGARPGRRLLRGGGQGGAGAAQDPRPAADLAVTCTATRVPVVTGHSAAVRVVCERPVDPTDARRGPGGLARRARSAPIPTTTPRPWRSPAARSCHVGRLRRDPHDDVRPAAVGRGRQPAQGRGLERRADRRAAGGGPASMIPGPALAPAARAAPRCWAACTRRSRVWAGCWPR